MDKHRWTTWKMDVPCEFGTSMTSFHCTETFAVADNDSERSLVNLSIATFSPFTEISASAAKADCTLAWKSVAGAELS